jgi:hypothetical protein
MKYMRVQSGAVTTTTDANGNFTLVGVNAPASVTVSYVGTFNSVINEIGAEYTLTQTLSSPTGNTILMNPSPTEA